MRRRRRAGSASGDEGSISLFFVIFLAAAFLLAGLVIDGGAAIDGRQRAADAAEQAARYGADDIDVATLRNSGVAEVEVGDACDRVDGMLARYGNDVKQESCVATPDSVTVVAQVKVTTLILGILGFDSFTVGAKAVAHPVAG